MSSQAEKQAGKATAQKYNENTASYFAASMLGLMVIITLFHRVGENLRSPLSKHDCQLFKRLVSATRAMRGILLFKIPSFTSIGHACIFILYLAINITLVVQNLESHLLGNFAKRMGWITACNLSLVVLLALKNSPLAFLTSFSYGQLNILHRIGGYCIMVSAILHAITYLVELSQLGALHLMRAQNQIMGIVAGSMLVIIFMTALNLKRISYEMFYATHIIFFILLIITLSLHRPLIKGKVVYIFISTAYTWALDRIYRFSKLCWFAYGNTTSVTPLGHGGVRIILSRTPERAIPGSHVFLWIPKIRKAEMHPFTVVSTNPLELVVSAHDGFTKDLLLFTLQNPGHRLRASCDGPYGTIPNFAKFDHVVLIAGGIGASFTFGVALDLIRKGSASTTKPIIHFIWAIRNREQQSWFSKEFTEISSSPLVIPVIYVTGSKVSTNSCSAPHKLSKGSDDRAAQTPADDKPSLTKSKIESNIDIEKEDSKIGVAMNNHSLSSLSSSVPIILGRPSTAAKIHDIVGNTESRDSIIVAVCGPERLMLEVRETVAYVASDGTRSVALHCEQFGW